jgi:hypothetical protein
VEVGLRKQLFVDDFVVAEKAGVTRGLGRAIKANGGRPVFTGGWFNGTVLHDQGKFKLWFRKPGARGHGYAESPDGLRFERKADVKGIPFAGDYNLAVEIDPHEADPAHRYKAGYDARGMAAGLAHSPTASPGPPPTRARRSPTAPPTPTTRSCGTPRPASTGCSRAPTSAPAAGRGRALSPRTSRSAAPAA